jgi:hypothetical protein
MEEIASPDFPEHATETAGVCDALAAWWDDAIGDGNASAVHHQGRVAKSSCSAKQSGLRDAS